MPALLANSGASLKIVPNGLKAHLDATSISGNAWTDLSGNNLSSAINGSVAYSTYNGRCLAFNGGYVQTPNMPLSGSANNPWTMGVWVNPSTFSGNIVSMSALSPVGGWNMPPISSNGSKFIGKIWQGAAAPANQLISSAYTTGNWYYVTLVWDQVNAAQNLYVNGVLAATQSNATYSASGVDNVLYLGQANPGSDNTGTFYGYMGNFHYYTRALTAAEVLQNYNALKARYATPIQNSF
jgi:hypothetical protein